MLVGSESGVLYMVLVTTVIESEFCGCAVPCAHDLDLDVPIGLETEPHTHGTPHAKEDVGKDGCEKQESVWVS